MLRPVNESQRGGILIAKRKRFRIDLLGHKLCLQFFTKGIVSDLPDKGSRHRQFTDHADHIGRAAARIILVGNGT